MTQFEDKYLIDQLVMRIASIREASNLVKEKIKFSKTKAKDKQKSLDLLLEYLELETDNALYEYEKFNKE